MPRCTHCGHEFAISEGFQCPACGKDWRGGDSVSRPAHLAVLEAGTGHAPIEEMPSEGSKKRLVSSVGPAVPVLKKQNDSVPNGWMARLEAARMLSGPEAEAQAKAEALHSGLKAAPAPGFKATPAPRPPTPPPLPSKPAHLLVAQLQQEDSSQGHAPAGPSDPVDEISSVKIDVPESLTEPKKRISDKVIIGVLSVLVLAGIGYVYSNAQKAPAPKVEIDPALKAEAEAKRSAIAALDKGHKLVLQEGKTEEAIKAYQEALKFDPKLAAAERGLAIALTKKKANAKAAKHYQKYLELAPDAADAKEVREIIKRYRKSQKK